MELMPLSSVQIDEVSREIIKDSHELAAEVRLRRPLSESVLKNLRKKILEETVYTSNAIEGSTLTLRETMVVLESGQAIDVGRQRESREALNLAAALRQSQQFLDSIGKLDRAGRLVAIADEAKLLDLHRTLLSGVRDDAAGRFRTERVMLKGAKHQPPNDRHVPQLVSNVMQTLRDSAGVEPIAVAAWTHWALARIHPFVDGNGRTARLWQDLILFANDLTVAIIPETSRKDYYLALQEADDGDLNPFIQLVAQCENAVWQRYINAARETDELAGWARQIVQEVKDREDESEQLAYLQWQHGMETVRDAFRRCAAQLSAAAGGALQIDVRDFPLIERPTWNSLRFAAGAKRTWFFRVFCRARERQAQYVFFFGHHYPEDGEPKGLQASPPLLVSERAAGDERFELLNDLETNEQSHRPVTLREIVSQSKQLYVKDWNIESDRFVWTERADAIEVAKRFFKQVLDFRLSA